MVMIQWINIKFTICSVTIIFKKLQENNHKTIASDFALQAR